MNGLKTFVVLATGIFAGLYLLNIGFGVAELSPDNFPLIGNLDEAAATLLVLNCLRYFGIDIRPFLKGGDSREPAVAIEPTEEKVARAQQASNTQPPAPS